MRKKLLAFILTLSLSLGMTTIVSAEYVVDDVVIKAMAEGKEVPLFAFEDNWDKAAVAYHANESTGKKLTADNIEYARSFSVFPNSESPGAFEVPKSGIEYTFVDKNISADKIYMMIAWYNPTIYDDNGEFNEEFEISENAWESMEVTVTDGMISGIVKELPGVQSVEYFEVIENPNVNEPSDEMADEDAPDEGVGVRATVNGKRIDLEAIEEKYHNADVLAEDYANKYAGKNFTYKNIGKDRQIWINVFDLVPENGITFTFTDARVSANKDYLMFAEYDEVVECIPVMVEDGKISGTMTLANPKGTYQIYYFEVIEDSENNTPSDENTEDNTTNSPENGSWMEKMEAADLHLKDGKWLYYKDGAFDGTKYAYVKFNDGIFLVANGVLCSEMNGLAADPNSTDWYYLAGGQVQTQETGLVMYDNAWFYVNEGRLDTTKAGCVSFDGSLFYVAAGQIKTDVNGLALDPITNQWYFLSNGQVQTQYTGLAQYDGEWFYIQNGALAVNYTGMVDYDGASFYVVNGMLK